MLKTLFINGRLSEYVHGKAITHEVVKLNRLSFQAVFNAYYKHTIILNRILDSLYTLTFNDNE